MRAEGRKTTEKAKKGVLSESRGRTTICEAPISSLKGLLKGVTLVLVLRLKCMGEITTRYSQEVCYDPV